MSESEKESASTSDDSGLASDVGVVGRRFSRALSLSLTLTLSLSLLSRRGSLRDHPPPWPPSITRISSCAESSPV